MINKLIFVLSFFSLSFPLFSMEHLEDREYKSANLFIRYQHQSSFRLNGRPDRLKVDNSASAKSLYSAMLSSDTAVLINGILAYPLILYSARNHCSDYKADMVARDDAHHFECFARYRKKNTSVLTEWDIYLVIRSDGSPTDKRFVLFVPKKGNIDVSQAFNTGVLKKLEFTPSVDEAKQKEQIDDILTAIDIKNKDGGSFETVVPSITSIFAHDSPYIWNIFLSGHGKSTTKPLLLDQNDKDFPIRVLLAVRDSKNIGVAVHHRNAISGSQADGLIANIPVKEVCKFFSFLYSIPVKCVTLSSCFCGGYHGELIENELKLLDKIVKEGGTFKRSFMLICPTSFDKLTYTFTSGQIEKLHEIFQRHFENIAEMKAEIAEVIAYERQPVFILMPDKEKFEAIRPSIDDLSPEDSDYEIDLGEDGSVRTLEALLDLGEKEFITQMIEPQFGYNTEDETDVSSGEEDESSSEKDNQSWSIDLITRITPRLSDSSLLALVFQMRYFIHGFVQDDIELCKRLEKADSFDKAYAFAQVVPFHWKGTIGKLIEEAKNTLFQPEMFRRVILRLVEDGNERALKCLFMRHYVEIMPLLDEDLIFHIYEWLSHNDSKQWVLLPIVAPYFWKFLKKEDQEKTFVWLFEHSQWEVLMGIVQSTEDLAEREFLLLRVFKSVGESGNEWKLPYLINEMKENEISLSPNCFMSLLKDDEKLLHTCYIKSLIDDEMILKVLKEHKEEIKEPLLRKFERILDKEFNLSALRNAIKMNDLLHVYLHLAYFSSDTLLIEALRQHQWEIAEEFFDESAENNYIKLIEVLKERNWNAAQWLMDHGMSKEDKDLALFNSLWEHDWESAHLLIEHGADPREVLKKYLTSGKQEIVEWLIEHEVDWSEGGQFALTTAVRQAWWRAVRLLIERGVNIEVEKDRILQKILGYHEWEIVKILIERGADIHYGTDFPLRKAINEHNWEIARWLVEHGANIHIDGEKAVKEAIKMEASDFVDFAYQQGGLRTRWPHLLGSCTIS